MIATGAAAVPVVPAVPVPTEITTVTAADYRNPGLLPPGGVLVVGASASGVQIADELRRSGRPVTLAVGEHVRMPRTYRGRDILWWLDAAGVLDERYEAQPDLVRARNLPSMQLVGSPQRATVDLNALRRRGVRLVGRFVGVRDDVAQFSGALPNVCALADLKLGRLLDTLDAWADRAGIDAEAPQRFAPTELPATTDLSARVGEGGIETIVWATGYRPDLSFVDAGVLDRKGRPVHDGGVTACSRPLPDRPAVPASPQVDPDRRGGVGRPRAGRAPRHPPGHARPPAGELRGTSVELHPVAAQVAADVARRDPQRLSALLTETVRLRALLPGGPIEAHGQENVAALLCALFADFDTVDVVESAGEPVADKLLIHYRLHVTQPAQRWVCTQTAVCRLVDGRLAVIDLLCSGFREIEINEDVPAPSGAQLVG